MQTQAPSFRAYPIGAALGAVVYGNLRVLGALALHNALDWEHTAAVYRQVEYVPLFTLQALGFFLVMGAPLFLVLRERNRLGLWTFVLLGAAVGAVAGFPYADWAVMCGLAGALAAGSSYAGVHVL